MRQPTIAFTMGDPAGIGPEILLRALFFGRLARICHPVIYGDYDLLRYTAAHLFKRRNAFQSQCERIVSWLKKPTVKKCSVIDFKNVNMKTFKWGKATASGGKASGAYIERAVRDALAKNVDAIVTLPINKVAFKKGGWGKKFPGHTEMLAALTRARAYTLMLQHHHLRAFHVTSHIPLKDVPQALTRQRVLETIDLAHHGLRAIGIRSPKIAVCGLNPHAGDGGVLGREERRVIEPAVRQARAKGVRVFGPLSADIVWPSVRDRLYDAGIAMYHDQGQIAVKLAAFCHRHQRTQVEGVNMTIGLPIIRTSVAHGTGYDIAGRGCASAQSLMDAARLAAQAIRR